MQHDNDSILLPFAACDRYYDDFDLCDSILVRCLSMCRNDSYLGYARRSRNCFHELLMWVLMGIKDNSVWSPEICAIDFDLPDLLLRVFIDDSCALYPILRI